MSAYFYLVNLYIVNLYFYLKSDIRDNVINRLFIENRKIFYKNYSGQTARMLLFYVLRFIPIRLLFCILDLFDNPHNPIVSSEDLVLLDPKAAPMYSTGTSLPKKYGY
jgi:hypothetical protein